MPRTLKNTRVKGLPPKVQLRNLDAITGSFPTHARLPSDNRTGVYGVVYDDLNTVVFKSYSGSLSLPSGLPVSNPALSNDELTSDIVVTGVLRKGVGDELISIPRPGQEFQPFRDDGNVAVDGLSARNPFYATGSRVSDVGEGFDQPLWSKSKFEVDLTPSVTHSFFIQNYTSASNNYPMAYWNKARKVWEGVGAGKEFGSYTAGDETAFRAFCEDQCIGFGNGINQGSVGNAEFSAGAKISNFSFPFHVKYHATSSNTIAMSDYIKSPFLLEKIVLEWSGSFNFNSTRFATSTNYTISTFFILNQRKPFAYNDPSYQSFVYKTGDSHTHDLVVSATIPGSYNGGSVYNTVRDLVTYAQVVGIASSAGATTIDRVSRDLTLISGPPRSGSFGAWNGRLTMSASVKNPLPNDGLDQIQVGHNDGGVRSMMTINKNSTRSGLFSPSGRDFVGSFSKGKLLQTTDVLIGDPSFVEPTGSIKVLDKYSKINPYLLQPSDHLIFGWQLPVANQINSPGGTPQYNGKGTELIFAPAPSKITFYGSFIREGKEHHDTLNQLLTSMAVHEVIE